MHMPSARPKLFWLAKSNEHQLHQTMNKFPVIYIASQRKGIRLSYSPEMCRLVGLQSWPWWFLALTLWPPAELGPHSRWRGPGLGQTSGQKSTPLNLCLQWLLAVDHHLIKRLGWSLKKSHTKYIFFPITNTLKKFSLNLFLININHKIHTAKSRWDHNKYIISIWAIATLLSKSTLGVLSISSKHLNFLDLELKENSRKIKLLEIGLEDQRSVDPNLCPKNCKTFLLPYQLFL